MSEFTRHLAYYADRLGLLIHRRQLVFYFRKPGGATVLPELPPGVEMRFLKSEELERLGYPGGWLKLPEARQWLERGGNDALAAIQAGRICAYMWVERKVARIDYLQLEAPLPRGHVYLSKVLVLPEYRKQGLAKALYRHLIAIEPEVVVHSACVTENLPMHMLFARLGWGARLLMAFRKIAAIRYYNLEWTVDGRKASFLSEPSVRRVLFEDE